MVVQHDLPHTKMQHVLIHKNELDSDKINMS